MKKCSYCGRENALDALTCVECGKALGSAPGSSVPKDLLDPGLSPVVVGTFGSLQEASVLVGRLEAAGIEAWVPEEYGAQVFSGVLGIEPLTVRVAAKDYQAAREALAEPAERSAQPIGGSESGTPDNGNGADGGISGTPEG